MSARPDQAGLRSRTLGWDLRDVDAATLGLLIAPRSAPDSDGRVKVEPKADTRARLGRSSDDADALLLAFYEPGVLTDPGYVYSFWTCLACGRLSTWELDRPCPTCGHQMPHDDPFVDGPGRPRRGVGPGTTVS